MKMNALRVHDVKRREPASRSLGDQVTALCLDRAIMKKDIARRLQVDASYIAQMFVRGMTAEMIVRMTDAINHLDKSGEPPISPFMFDRYVWLMIPLYTDDDPDLIRIFRSVMNEWSGSKIEMFKRTGLAMTGKPNGGGGGPRRKARP